MNDNAVTVAPQGATTFDVTDEILKLGREAALQLRDDTHDTDHLRHAETAPQWIKDWTGPFIICVEQTIEAHFATEQQDDITNDTRAKRALALMATYAPVRLSPASEAPDTIADAIADLLHLASANGADGPLIDRIINLARLHHRAEQADLSEHSRKAP